MNEYTDDDGVQYIRRSIKLAEAYAVLRESGCGWFTAGFMGVIWWAREVQVLEDVG